MTSLRRGFTLIELLVVIALLGVLAALLLPAVQAAREAARKVQCRNNLKQMGIALHQYHDGHACFPIGYVAAPSLDPAATSPGWGWGARLLPQLEQGPLFDAINVNLAVEHAANLTARTSRLAVFVCPTDRPTGRFAVVRDDGSPIVEAETNSYAGNYGRGGEIADAPEQGNGVFLRNRVVALGDLIDGSSRTFAFGERGSLLTRTAWAGAINGGVCMVTPGAPTSSRAVEEGGVQVLAHTGSAVVNGPDADPDDFFSPHAGGAHFLMGDGSAHFIKSSIHVEVYRALSSRNGGEVVGEDAF
jgi:prepilin-type N-terminal cleavage/methylation domain-containing protein